MARAIPNNSVILVVEDEPLIRLAAMDLIAELGHQALEASSADEAIALLEAHPEISIVFTDVQMAGSMDGIALSHWAASRWPPLRFIIVSGGVTIRLDELPANARFQTKPYRGLAISEAIASFQ